MSGPTNRLQIEQESNNAVRTQRLVAAGISEKEIERLSTRLSLEVHPINEKGEQGEKEAGNGWVLGSSSRFSSTSRPSYTGR